MMNPTKAASAAAAAASRRVGSTVTVGSWSLAASSSSSFSSKRQQQQRWSSAGASGNRLAGRSRFYKEVGTRALDTAPWEEVATTTTASTTGEESDTVASPISAGVDGSQSATGVHHVPQKQTNKSLLSLEKMLTPRCRGEEHAALVERESNHSSNDNNNNDNNNNNNNNTQWYGVTLDGRKVSTPMGKILAVPSETLAYMIAAEWDSQTKELQPSNMPLMTLACTALDQAAHQPQFYRDTALMYLPTDTTCFWADPTEDRLLHRRQQQSWKGLHDFCTERLGGASPVTAFGMEGMLMSRKRGDEKPKSGLPHPESLVEAATSWTHSLDAWQLVALNSIATQAKSFLIAFAMLESAGLSVGTPVGGTSSTVPFADVAKASEASRVEEEFQISVWGMVEGQHDYDRLNCSIQLHSANLFAKTILMENS